MPWMSSRHPKSHDPREKSGSVSISGCLCSSNWMSYYHGIASMIPKKWLGHLEVVVARSVFSVG